MKITNLLYVVLFIITSCVVQPKVAYNVASVPEEGGIKFTQITREDEKVLGGTVRVNENGSLQWYAAPIISVSPDGKDIAYLATGNDFHNLYIRELAGGRKKIQRTFNRNVLDMSYSNDGKHIVFTEQEGIYDSNIRLINSRQGAAISQIAASSKSEVGPVFATDDKSVFYTVENADRFYIWNTQIETGLNTQYSEGFTPVVAKDGKSLYITRNNRERGTGEIWQIDLVSGSETLILSSPTQGFSSPAVSPDGKILIVVGTSPKTETRPQNLDIYSIRTDGTKLTQLTFHGGHDFSPVWSIDGKSVLFLAQRANEDGAYNIWSMELLNNNI